VNRKPTVEDLGIEVGAQAWRRSGDRDGAIEIAFVPEHAVAGVAAGSRGVSAGRGAGGAEWVLMRVAGDPAGRVLVYDRNEWECFLDGVRGGEFDDGAS
jgi:Domain of unknown function (DUF397)